HAKDCELAKQRLEGWGLPAEKGECLVRYFWPVLDRGNRSEPIAQMLLEQVDSLEIEVLGALLQTADNNDSSGSGFTEQQWHNNWPELQYGEGQNNRVLRAVRWRIRLPNLG